MSAAPTLTSAKVHLRALTLDDARDLHAAHGDADTHKFWAGPAFESITQTQHYIADTLAMPGAHVWAITEAGQTALGRIALFTVREGVGEIGIILAPQAQGKGFGGAALRLVEAHAFGPLGMHRLTADVDPDNRASLALFRRAGFAREGLLRGNWKTHLGIRDSVIFGKLKPAK